MPPQPASKAKIFAFLNFLCSKLRGCGKGNKVATKTNWDWGMGILYCKISDIALVAAYKVIEMIANMSLLSCSKNKFIHSRMCE